MQPLTSHHLLPPFPDNIKTAPLVSVKFEALERGDQEESATFFRACKELGFFYLDLLGSEIGETIVAEAERLNKLQQKFFELPNEVKDVYGRPHLHPFYAYRFNDLSIKDDNGVPLRAESYNVSSSGSSGVYSFLRDTGADLFSTAAQRRHSRKLRPTCVSCDDP